MLVALLASTALAAPPPGRGGPPEGAGPPEGQGPTQPTPVSPVGVSVDDTSAIEGTPLTFTIALDQSTTTDVTVQYETTDGTATAGSDYTAASGQVVITAGTTSASVDVDTAGDEVDNGDRTFTLDLTAVSTGATIVDGSGTGTILDDDEPVSGTSMVTIEDVTVDEDAGGLFVRVFADPAPSEPITVDWHTVDGSATAGDDYTADSGTVTINADATVGTLGIGKVVDDDLEEPETFTVVLSNPSPNATIADDTGVVTIVEGFCGTTVGIPVDSGWAFNDLTCHQPNPDHYILHAPPGSGGDPEVIPAGTTVHAFVTNDAGATDLRMALEFAPVEGGDGGEVAATPVLDGSDNQIGLELEYTLPSDGWTSLMVMPADEADLSAEVLYHLELTFPTSSP